jgi:antitoxin component of MazEF toxin-antitoxin module
MTTIKQVPATLLQALGLHKGDFLTVRDESPSEFVIEITTGLHPTSPPDDNTRRAALARFAIGAKIEQPATEQELDDARYEALRAKHLK